ncbi:MAG: hypothetical protein RLZZ591_358 [Pseudomonadota bacterium]
MGMREQTQCTFFFQQGKRTIQAKKPQIIENRKSSSVLLAKTTFCLNVANIARLSFEGPEIRLRHGVPPRSKR